MRFSPYRRLKRTGTFLYKIVFENQPTKKDRSVNYNQVRPDDFVNKFTDYKVFVISLPSDRLSPAIEVNYGA